MVGMTNFAMERLPIEKGERPEFQAVTCAVRAKLRPLNNG